MISLSYRSLNRCFCTLPKSRSLLRAKRSSEKSSLIDMPLSFSLWADDKTAAFCLKKQNFTIMGCFLSEPKWPRRWALSISDGWISSPSLSRQSLRTCSSDSAHVSFSVSLILKNRRFDLRDGASESTYLQTGYFILQSRNLFVDFTLQSGNLFADIGFWCAG